MTQQIINVGSGPSAGDGDPLRTAFIEINSNFTELYGTINGQAVTYSNVSGVTTSLGQGATFDVTKYVNSYSFVINRSGNGYSGGDTITIYGNLIGGAYSTQDVTVTVATLGNVTLGNIATFAFSGIPAQPVTSVAGRTGGVILTINDIVGYINPNVAIAGTMPTYTGNISAGNITTTGIVKTGVYTVTSLPSASTSGAGARAFVTDANTVVFGSALTGGAGNAVPVFSNGTTWRIG